MFCKNGYNAENISIHMYLQSQTVVHDQHVTHSQCVLYYAQYCNHITYHTCFIVSGNVTIHIVDKSKDMSLYILNKFINILHFHCG